MATAMQGRRLPDGEWFEDHSPGDYGRVLITKTRDGQEFQEWDWFVCCPDGSTTVLWVNEDDRHGNWHIITEHDDGSITVGGSIMGGQIVPTVVLVGEVKGPGDFWHGYLEHGVWREV